MSRISLDEYFMKICTAVGERSTCCRRKVGAVLVYDKRLLASGYNGSPVGIANCCDVGICLREESKSGENLATCYAVHAEQNAICSAARFGISTEGATLYCTTKPCNVCAKLIINAGIKEVIYSDDYPDYLTDIILAPIKLTKFK